MLKLKQCIITVLPFLLIGCSSIKQTPDYKTDFKAVDTLAFLTPHIVVESKNRTSRYFDEELAEKLTIRISHITYSTLKGKFQIVNTSFRLGPEYIDSISYFLNNLNSFSKELPPTTIPAWLRQENYENEPRYFLATFIYSFYDSDYEPNYAWTKGSSESLIQRAQRPVLSGVSAIVLVCDKETNKVLFFNEESTYQCDPRVPTEVEAMVKSLIRPVYYK